MIKRIKPKTLALSHDIYFCYDRIKYWISEIIKKYSIPKNNTEFQTNYDICIRLITEVEYYENIYTLTRNSEKIEESIEKMRKFACNEFDHLLAQKLYKRLKKIESIIKYNAKDQNY